MNVYGFLSRHSKTGETDYASTVVCRDELDFWRTMDGWNQQVATSGFTYRSDQKFQIRWATDAEMKTLHKAKDRAS